MKNSIFKNYSKKILKSEAFISVIIVFVLAIGIIGTSYALYMDVDTDTDYQIVQVGDLAVGFDNGNNVISLKNMTPSDDDIALKSSDNIFSFYIYNTGTYTTDYNIKLIASDGNEVSEQFINYQICKDNAKNCEDIKTLSDMKDFIIYNDELGPKKENEQTNPSVYYFLRIWINKNYKNNETEKNIKLKVVIDSYNANGNIDNKNTLVGTILNNSKINTNSVDLNANTIEENTLYKMNDDSGISYFYRGNRVNNYIEFENLNMCFKIVRIEGDRSIKLVLDDKNNKCSNSNKNNIIGTANYGYLIENDITIPSINNDNNNSLKNVLNNFKDNEIISIISNLKQEKWCVNNYIEGKYSLKCNTDETFENYVGLLTIDELILSGTNISKENTYLNYNGWTINRNNDKSYIYNGTNIEEKNPGEEFNVIPSIVLKKDILHKKGNGTKENPYIINAN